MDSSAVSIDLVLGRETKRKVLRAIADQVVLVPAGGEATSATWVTTSQGGECRVSSEKHKYTSSHPHFHIIYS